MQILRVASAVRVDFRGIYERGTELGVSYWQIRNAIRRGYVAVRRPETQRKLYLKPSEVRAIKEFFGTVESQGVK